MKKLKTGLMLNLILESRHILISKELIKMPSHQRAIAERSSALNAFQRLIAERKAAAHAICAAVRLEKKAKDTKPRFDWAHARPEERAAWTKAKEMRLASRFLN